jgi:hypothetical protein
MSCKAPNPGHECDPSDRLSAPGAGGPNGAEGIITTGGPGGSRNVTRPLGRFIIWFLSLPGDRKVRGRCTIAGDHRPGAAMPLLDHVPALGRSPSLAF